MSPAPNGSVLERHAQTVIGAVLIGLILWVGSTTSSTATRVALVEQHVSLLSVMVSELKAEVQRGVDDRYRSSDARRDLASRDARLDRIEHRIDKIEKDHVRITK